MVLFALKSKYPTKSRAREVVNNNVLSASQTEGRKKDLCAKLIFIENCTSITRNSLRRARQRENESRCTEYGERCKFGFVYLKIGGRNCAEKVPIVF